MNKVVVGMVGAGRGAELHMEGYSRVYGIDLKLKKIMGRRAEQVIPAQEKYGFSEAVFDFNNLINDPEINLIDICSPPYTHFDMVIKALNAGKNVICEKPLTGCFDINLSKKDMYYQLCHSLETLQEALTKSGKHFMYAENFVYSPQIQRTAELIEARKNKILFIKGEESLKGSSSPVAGEWSKTGGGTLMRVGSHPLGAAIYLKQIEAISKGININLESVICDCTQITPSLSEFEHRAINAYPHDVEDMCTLILSFTDGSRCTIIANDTLLGGSKNYIELYCNDAVINCKLTLSDLMETYFPDDKGLETIQLSEMLPLKTGWNKPFIADNVIRGYVSEIQDFCESVAFDRDAKSSFKLAYDTTIAMYGAYYSAETNKRIYFKTN